MHGRKPVSRGRRMRRSRRGGGSSSEFGSSGEDSFVAVVVTKLTGALLFILLLTMVIMALLPKAVDLEIEEKSPLKAEGKEGSRCEIATPTRLPEAIAGRSYLVALAATGGRGPLHWSVDETRSRVALTRRAHRPARRHSSQGDGRTARARSA